MAFFWIILFGLFGSRLASAEEIVTGTKIEMSGTSGPHVIMTGKKNEMPGTSGPSDDAYMQMVREIYEVIKLHRMRDEPLVGQNEFEVVQKWNGIRRRRVPEMPHETFKRVKRGFLTPGCKADAEGRFISCNQGNNDFQSGSTPKTYLRDRWEDVKAKMATTQEPIHNDFGPDSECYTDRKLRFYRVFNNITNGGKKVEKLTEAKPEDFIEKHKSKRQTGCSCEFTLNNIGCACCFLFQQMNIMICAGCGYTATRVDSKFYVRITVESFTILKYEKELARSAFYKYLTLFRKSVCLPHQFSWVLTACLQLTINFIPSFTKNKPSQISTCVSIVASLFLLYEVTLLTLPCWELDFRLPFFRVAGEKENAHMTYEGKLTLDQPVKKMLAPADKQRFKQLEKLVYDLGEMERNNSKTNGPKSGSRQGGKWIQNTGEEPRELKRGNPTLPINWEPAETGQTHWLVVLYTQPLASPLTRKDLEEEDTKAMPNIRKMTEDGLDRQLPNNDPSIINLKVHASLGKSCGGVILTSNKLLTLCACIKFFYMFHKYKYKLQPSDKLDVFTLLSEDIYVTYAHRRFHADQIILELDNQEEHFMKTSRCFDAIKSGIGKPIDDGSFTDTHMHSVVMTVNGIFQSWSQILLVPFDDRVSSSADGVNMLTIGMRKAHYLDIFGKDGYEFDPLYEVVKVPFVTCPQKTGFCRNPLDVPRGSVSKEFEEKTECFCAKDRAFQLCDGVIGFPLTTDAGVIGLNAIPMHCKGKGSMVGAVFSEDSLAEIKAYLALPDPPTTFPAGFSPSGPTPASRSPRPIQLSGFVLAASMSMTIISHLVLIV